jgi:hypothetical protein
MGLALVVGEAGLAGGGGARQTRVVALPGFRRTTAVAGLNLSHELAEALNGAGLDSHRS